MRTVGEILKKARLDKKLNLDEIEIQLKIRKKYLNALEDNSWNDLPSLPYIKGFLKNYSEYLNLNPVDILAVFRRQFSHEENLGLLPKGVAHPLNQFPIHLTPKTISWLIIPTFFILFFLYIFYQYRGFVNPPNLTIIKPSEGEILQNENVLIQGETDPDAVLTINNQKIALNENGGFSTTIVLSPGINTIFIESTSKNGKKRIGNRTIQIQENN